MSVFKRRGFPIRILPITIIAVLVALLLKMNDVIDQVAVAAENISIGPKDAVAQGVTRPAQAQGMALQGQAFQGQANQGAAQRAIGTTDTTVATAQPLPTELQRDPTRFSQSEIDLLQALAARRDALDARERELTQREALLRAAERRLEEKVAELDGVKAELLRLISRRNEEEDSRLRSLVRIYEAMKPKDAALILEKLDMDVVIGVIERMKETKVAPILASMVPERAKTVTTLLADRKSLVPALRP